MTTRLIRVLAGLCLVIVGFSACGKTREFTPATQNSAGSGGAEGGSGPKGACSLGEMRCDGLTPQRCSDDGAWVAAQASCAIACLDAQCVQCEEGTTTCKDGAVQRCVEGAWATDQVCPKVCQGDRCVDSCTEGLLQCNGSRSLQKCAGGVFVDDTACDFLCRGGACIGDCAPDVTRCNPDAQNESQVCGAQGTWGESSACASGAFCVAGKCAPCMPGTSRCAPTGPQLCSPVGEWVNQGLCADPSPACFEGKCVLCSPGTKRCSGQSVEECTADGSRWSVIATCSGDTPACLESTKTCGKCAQGDTQCLDGKVQTCDGQSVFQTTTTCAGDTPRCTGGKCTACDPTASERRCATSATTQACAPGGDWAAPSKCPDDTPLCREDLGFKCGCEEGARRCRTNKVPEVCQGGDWIAQTECTGELDYCLPATGRCVDCVPQKAECLNGLAHQCNDAGAFESLNSCSGPGINCGNCGVGDACAKSAECMSGFCVGGKCAVCDPATRGCLGATPRLCTSSGSWMNEGSCSGTTPQCLDGQCVECKGTEKRSCGNCNTGTQTCSDNSWGPCVGAVDLKTSSQYCGACNVSCSAGQLCENGACVVDCGTKTRCNGVCVDLSTDTSNCLACGTKCAPPASNGSAVCKASGCDISCTNTRCGTSCCAATPSGSTAGCSGNTCTFTCNSGSHGCGGSSPPCYSNTDATHCGASCLNCASYAGTTGACSSNQCACEASSALACAANVPTCGSWDFNSNTVEGWRFGDYRPASEHHWVGSLGTSVTNGSPALTAQYDGAVAGGGVVEFEVDLCPNAANLNLTGYQLTYDFYFQTSGGSHFSAGTGDATSILVNNTGVITGCQPFVDPASDEWITGRCANLPSSVQNLTIVFRLSVGWAGKVYLDNVKLTPK